MNDQQSQDLNEVHSEVFGCPQREEMGLKSEVRAIKTELYGSSEKLGISQKVAVMWRAHIWVVAALSALGGFLVHGLLQVLGIHF